MQNFDIATSMQDFEMPTGSGSGLTTAQSDLLTQIAAKTALIGAGTISAVSAVTDDLDIIITQYDDYLDIDGRALSWTNPDGAWAGGDLTDSTITFTVKDREGETAIFSSTQFIIKAATDVQIIAIELSSQQTALFSRIGKSYRYQILIIKEGTRETAINGYLTSKKSLSPPI